MDVNVEDLVMVLRPDTPDYYSLARVKSIEGHNLVFRTIKGEEFSIPKNQSKKDGKDVVTLINDKCLESTSDMTKLELLHESIILHNLKQRWENGVIYTYIGPMIVSVNPHQSVENDYGPQFIPDYMKKERDELKPHLYSMAQKAYKALLDSGLSQSIIISGESGSGKTEATKIVLKYLTEASKASSTNSNNVDIGLADKILATNPIMEAFGNAKTTRNNNSSRFGKFVKILFDGSQICGAQIDNYLLEKIRVVDQLPEERNYHIFYQLINYSTPSQKERYKLLSRVEDYGAFMKNGNIQIPPIKSKDGTIKADYDDKKEFLSVQEAFLKLGFSNTEVDEIFKILSSILWLGNVRFGSTESEQAQVIDSAPLQVFCDLLGFENIIDVKKALTIQRLGTANKLTGSTTIKHLDATAAENNKRALAKSLYACLFDWLVKKLNQQLQGTGSIDSKFIGVLDIYGFEDFGAEKNSMEQFLINYANEKLHQQFIHHMFKSEQEEYKSEGVEWSTISFVDNLRMFILAPSFP